MITVFAPAKVNLCLHVGPLRPDGYHPIASLIAFADVGDVLRAQPAESLSLAVSGPFAAHAPAGEDNLVLRAVRLLAREARVEPNLSLALEKQIPAGAGLGGGSSDAGAALLAARALLAPHLSDEDLFDMAAALGSDVAACLMAEPLVAEGWGERLTPAPGLPPLDAVLVHPGRHVSTSRVFAAFDAAPAPELFDLPPFAADWMGWLRSTRNDLAAPAQGLEPAIAEVLAALEAQSETRLARMSGSGSACFALCDGAETARDLANRLGREHPGWWVRACRLGSPPWRTVAEMADETADRGRDARAAGGGAGHG